MTGVIVAAVCGAAIPPIVAISDTHVDSLSGTTATSTFQLEPDGDIGKYVNALYTDLGDWITPTGAAGNDYEAKMTTISGFLSSGTAGSWLALGTLRAWTRTSSSGTQTYVGTLEIRRASDGTVLDSATITLQARKI